jgi:uncharacterized membrane-anchored protein
MFHTFQKNIIAFVSGTVICCAILASQIIRYEHILTNGVEVLVPIWWFDPRDFFRGDYIVLNYPMSQLTVTQNSKLFDQEFNYNQKIFVIPQFSWNTMIGIDSISTTKPSTWIFFQASISYDWIEENTEFNKTPDGLPRKHIALNFWQDRFFVREGSGLKREEKITNQEINDYAIRRISPDGINILKGIIVDWEIVINQ